jgi:hypothetical protein
VTSRTLKERRGSNRIEDFVRAHPIAFTFAEVAIGIGITAGAITGARKLGEADRAKMAASQRGSPDRSEIDLALQVLETGKGSIVCEWAGGKDTFAFPNKRFDQFDERTQHQILQGLRTGLCHGVLAPSPKAVNTLPSPQKTPAPDVPKQRVSRTTGIGYRLTRNS